MWMFLLIVPAWIIIGKWFPNYSMSDGRAIRRFRQHGIQLHTKTIISKGHKLHYVWTGNETDPVIVFIHGSPGSWTFFEKYLRDKKLLRHYKLVAIDRPGFGQSEFGKSQSIQKQASIIAPVINELCAEHSLLLVGHSFGGPLVVKLAALCNVSTILIVAGCLDPEEENPGRWMKIQSLPPIRWFLPGVFRQSNDELIQLKQNLKKLLKDYSKIKCRVILMHGTNDRNVSIRNMEWASKKFIMHPV